MSGKVAPQILKGMRDILPSRMILRQHVITTVRRVFERYGFEPLETPAIEYAETLEGKFGEEADKLIYRFDDRGERRVGLRYDLTVPLARVVSMYPELPKPFRRYQISPVWRAEKPQKGRYREFYQCDVDIVGTTSRLADAESVAVANAALLELGFTRIRIKLNDRQLLSALASYAGVQSEHRTATFRSIDKLEKIGRRAVEAELSESGLPTEVITRLFAVLLPAQAGVSLLDHLAVSLNDYPGGPEGVESLRQLTGFLSDLGVDESRYEIDLSMVRGLDYYTGPIFEAVVEEPRIGSICGGGRYDNLVAMFGGQGQPAVGISIGLERIIDVIEELNLLSGTAATITQALVTVFSPESRPDSLRLVRDLRAAGINSEVFIPTGSDRLPNQLKYASRKSIPIALIAGPDEVAAGVVQVKDLRSGQQSSCARAEVPAYVKGLLGV